MNRRRFLVSASVLTLAASLGLAARDAAAAADTEAVFALASSEIGAASQDPIRATLLSTVVMLIYDRLIEQDVDQSYHPHLAESWETSADGMSWTFKLRQGVRFHDGEPFNAATIAWWIPKFKGTPNEYLVDGVARVEGVVVD